MVLIFLDIDGVLATYSEYNQNRRKFWGKYNTANQLHIPYRFNVKCVDVLNQIIENTSCDIILSSDWRLHWNLDELDVIFKFNGVLKSPIDTTITINSSNYIKNRADEINTYINQHIVKKYVIIDDLDLTKYVDSSRFVKTTEKEGIKKSGLMSKIVKILTE